MPEYRGRLPHFHPNDAYVFVTWRLWGSLPAKPDLTRHPTPGHAFAARDRVLDRHASGPRWLHDPRVADVAAEAILIGECGRHFYRLRSWVVMPNHVHLLILPVVPVPVLMRWLKGSTARSANRIIGQTGQPFGKTSRGIITCADRVKSTGLRRTSKKTPFPPDWCALRNAGAGQVPVGRRNRPPHQTCQFNRSKRRDFRTIGPMPVHRRP